MAIVVRHTPSTCQHVWSLSRPAGFIDSSFAKFIRTRIRKEPESGRSPNQEGALAMRCVNQLLDAVRTDIVERRSRLNARH